jgi:hypothetical protein
MQIALVLWSPANPHAAAVNVAAVNVAAIHYFNLARKADSDD